MKLLPVTWNISRVLLIILCCYQVALGMLDSNQASRMLSITEGPESYRATQAPLDNSRVVAVLNRRGQASWGWLTALGFLALCRYSPLSPGSSRRTKIAEQATTFDGDKPSN